MKNNFYINLRTQYENLGDYLIAQATIDFLKDMGDITLDINNVPESYLELFNIPENVTLTKRGLLSTLFFSKKRNWIYVLKPGGYTTSKSTLYQIKLILINLYLLLCKSFFNVKLFKMPHSYLGKMNIIEKLHQKLYDLIIVRDKISLNNYNNHKIFNTILAKDIASYYFNKKSKFNNLEELERNNISISLRYDRNENEGDISYKIANYLLNTEKLNKIIYVSQVTFDNKINNKYSQKNNLKYTNYNISEYSIKEITKKYKSSKYIISNRLHSLLLAKINGAIPIAIIDINKDQKIIGSLDLLKIQWINKNDFMTKNFEEKLYLTINNNKTNVTYNEIDKKILKKLIS